MKFRPDILGWLVTGLFAVAVAVPLSTAQMRGGVGRPATGAHAGFARDGRSGNGLGHRFTRHYFSQDHFTRDHFTQGYLGSPFLYGDYDSADSYIADNSADNSDEGAPTQLVVLRPATDDSPRKGRSTPLLIEWRGDRYVRFGGSDENGNSTHADYAESTATKVAGAQKPAESAATELPPAVLVYQLVYRDGHREEISDYAIADGVIYVRANYWQNGDWVKRIPLSALDASATMQANQQRGIKFLLPSAANVVIASF